MATGEPKEFYKGIAYQTGCNPLVPPPTPTPPTLREELRFIVERLYTVNGRLIRTHQSLFSPPEPTCGQTRNESQCVRDDLNELCDVLTDIEQYAKEIEERIG